MLQNFKLTVALVVIEIFYKKFVKMNAHKNLHYRAKQAFNGIIV